MSTQETRSNHINEKTQLLVAGYSRRHERQFELLIPGAIQELFLIFYWINEYFTDHGNLMQLNETKLICTMSNPSTKKYNTVYGNNVIDIKNTSITEYKWTFKINKLSNYQINNKPIGIGIDSSNNKFIEDDFGYPSDHSDRKNRSPFYCYGSNGAMYAHTRGETWLENEVLTKEGDIVEMKLNTINKTLIFLVNESEPIIIAKKIEETDHYNMAISMTSKGTEYPMEIELIDFQTIYK